VPRHEINKFFPDSAIYFRFCGISRAFVAGRPGPEGISKRMIGEPMMYHRNATFCGCPHFNNGKIQFYP
jgi:hypothetical protein